MSTSETAPSEAPTTGGYRLQGTLLEACTCDVLCPCWIGEDPDGGTCQSIMAYHLDSGTIGGVDVSGLTLAAVVFIPGNVLAGNWKQAVFVDDRATDEQEQALLAAFGGALGGPLGDLAQLVGERLAVTRAPISHADRRGQGHDPGRRQRRRRRDGALPRARRERDHPEQLDLLHRAGLPGMGGEVEPLRGQPPRARLDLPGRGPQRDPVGLGDRLPR